MNRAIEPATPEEIGEQYGEGWEMFLHEAFDPDSIPGNVDDDYHIKKVFKAYMEDDAIEFMRLFGHVKEYVLSQALHRAEVRGDIGLKIDSLIEGLRQ